MPATVDSNTRRGLSTGLRSFSSVGRSPRITPRRTSWRPQAKSMTAGSAAPKAGRTWTPTISGFGPVVFGEAAGQGYWPNPSEFYDVVYQGVEQGGTQWPNLRSIDEFRNYLTAGYAPWYQEVVWPARQAAGYSGDVEIPGPPEFGAAFNPYNYPGLFAYEPVAAPESVDMASALAGITAPYEETLATTQGQLNTLAAQLAESQQRTEAQDALMMALMSGMYGGGNTGYAAPSYQFGAYYPAGMNPWEG